MSKISYADRRFRVIANSESGEVSDETVFHYHQSGSLVWADYSGGDVARGHLIALCDEDGRLDMRYHHLNLHGEIMTGICTSWPELLADGRLRLHEQWRWTSGDLSSGTSVLEEY